LPSNKSTPGNGSKSTAIYGTKDADNLQHDGVRDLYAGAGNDTITTASMNYNTKIYAEGGDDNITSNYYYSNSNDWVDGGKGNDKISTGAGADTVQGGDGADDITGGTGDDLLSGGSGPDLFNFSYMREYNYNYETYEYTYKLVGQDGNDTITDFNVAQDHLKLSGYYYEVDPSPNILLQDTSAGTLVSFEGGGSILLQNVHGYASAAEASGWLHLG
jgi:Ca2+-binding RTX toxin-like protein